ncbi:2-oxo acid dehydrogenase, partial [Mycobacteroides abscessus subsp. massiliense]
GSVDVKLALDKTDGGVRHVASAVIRDVASLDVEGIQAHVDRLRDTPAAELDELAGSRLLDRLPPLLGTWAFGFATRLSRRSEVLGTVALSSLGHADV